MERKIDDIVSVLKAAKRSNRRCSLLIGAGCSVSAGIPLASQFVEIIKDQYPSAYGRAETKTYPHCMYELEPGIRRDLIARYIDQAKINWAHIVIAQLVKHGYVDRVLTPNFDPLVMRACALAGEFPAVYDFAASQQFNPAYVSAKAIFHLHGQRDGFNLLHTDEEVNALTDALTPVFDDAGKGRMWLVVGYSGDNDPVFKHLARVKEFDFGLYWVTYRDDEPAAHVQSGLLQKNKGAFYVKGYDADEFFVKLARELDCFPPDLIARPFSHLDSLLKMLTPYDLRISSTEAESDAWATTRTFVEAAIHRYEKPTTGLDDDGLNADKEQEEARRQVLATEQALLAADYIGVVQRLFHKPTEQNPPAA